MHDWQIARSQIHFLDNLLVFKLYFECSITLLLCWHATNVSSAHIIQVVLNPKLVLLLWCLPQHFLFEIRILITRTTGTRQLKYTLRLLSGSRCKWSSGGETFEKNHNTAVSPGRSRLAWYSSRFVQLYATISVVHQWHQIRWRITRLIILLYKNYVDVAVCTTSNASLSFAPE